MIETNPYTSKSVILFDGYCNLCSWAVQFVVKRDKKKKFKFASLQSEYGIKILLENNLPATDFNSLVLVENGKIYTQSTMEGYPVNRKNKQRNKITNIHR